MLHDFCTPCTVLYIGLTCRSTVSATLTSIKTVTAPGTTTVVVNGKRDVEDSGNQLKDRALFDFALLASMGGLDLSLPSVSSACSCFASSYTAATATSTVVGTHTVTVAVAKATVPLTTTVKAATV